MNKLIKHCNCLPQQTSERFDDHSPYCAYITVAKMAHRIDELEASGMFLLSFAPKDTVVPKGLDPTFYHTLSADGDQKLANRINKIKAEVKDE
jgi:hypothetical protein